MTAEPDGLREAFAAYEQALMDDDLDVLGRLFEDGPDTLRGDPGGLLVGWAEISDFRRTRGGAPARRLVDVHVRPVAPDAAVVLAVFEPARGGRGLQTQLWVRREGEWVVRAAHVAPPPSTFDSVVWRVVGDPLVPPTGSGMLDGETVAVKDLFSVAGHQVGAGVPAFLATQPPATRHATAVQRLLDAGASLRGIARTDQLAYSLAGDNPHYGTPVNPLVPGGLPGGSSSGSATAVSLGAASIGLATDTAGSVRVPASYQGLWGLRTTHGAVPADGLVPLAPDFDAVGLLTRHPDMLRRAAVALLGSAATADGPLGEVVVPVGHSALVPDLPVTEVPLPDLAPVVEAFRVHQGYQAWQAHGGWLRDHPGALLGSVAQRFESASRVTADEDLEACEFLSEAQERLVGLLGDSVLVLPSAASAAPRVWAAPEEVEAARSATFRLTCVAGVLGRPAVARPWRDTEDGPVGLSLVGPPGSDLALIGLAASLRPPRQ